MSMRKFFIFSVVQSKLMMVVQTAMIFSIVAGSLVPANLSILAPCDLFKEVVWKKSGFYVN